MPGAAELRMLVNPESLEAETGADFLARCFATRWTEAMYRWYLARAFAGEQPDRLVLAEGGHAVAACGVVYRRLRTSDGQAHRVGIAVAGCTLPSVRGRGYWARVLEATADRAALRGCTALLGFARADRASVGAFERLGAVIIPSGYIVSRDRAPPPRAAILHLRDSPAGDDWPRRAEARARGRDSCAGFDYPDALEWRSQMIDRPHGVESVRIGATSRAVIESVDGTDRLQWLDGDERERVAAIRTVTARARRRGRKFFMYSTCPHETAAARRLGLTAHPGYMLAVPLQARSAAVVRDWTGMSWRVQSGDRM